MMKKNEHSIFLVGGARPNFMKIAPLIWEFERKQINYKLIHTGQHYDYEMSKVFFEELKIPKPDYFLDAGSGSHAEQTAKIMIEFEKVCASDRPNIVAVVGDVNSTLACSVTAKKLNIKVAHIEAGLRSSDMTMPEEINRIVTDTISDFLFVTEKSGKKNLKKEGKSVDQIFFVGNTMIDTLYYGLEKLNSRPTSRDLIDIYAVITLHRPSNVDQRDKLEEILTALKKIANDMPVYFPAHPRTSGNIKRFGLDYLLENSNIKLCSPMSYLDFLALWKDAGLVLTDSGGLQEETTVLHIPCFTIRDNTERPVTVEEGTNLVVGSSGGAIIDAYKDFKKGRIKKGHIPKFWDGMTAKRITEILLQI